MPSADRRERSGSANTRLQSICLDRAIAPHLAAARCEFIESRSIPSSPRGATRLDAPIASSSKASAVGRCHFRLADAGRSRARARLAGDPRRRPAPWLHQPCVAQLARDRGRWLHLVGWIANRIDSGDGEGGRESRFAAAPHRGTVARRARSCARRDRQLACRSRSVPRGSDR